MRELGELLKELLEWLGIPRLVARVLALLLIIGTVIWFSLPGKRGLILIVAIAIFGLVVVLSLAIKYLKKKPTAPGRFLAGGRLLARLKNSRRPVPSPSSILQMQLWQRYESLNDIQKICLGQIHRNNGRKIVPLDEIVLENQTVSEAESAREFKKLEKQGFVRCVECIPNFGRISNSKDPQYLLLYETTHEAMVVLEILDQQGKLPGSKEEALEEWEPAAEAP